MSLLNAEAPPLAGGHASLRVRRVQHLCSQLSLDGILLVPGLDGKFNQGSQQAVGYLLDGKSNRDAIDPTKLSNGLEDAVVLVKPQGMAVYTPSSSMQEDLQELLLPHSPNVVFFSPTSEEAADPDASEENKLASFVQMLRGCKRLGIPCNLAGSQQPTANGNHAVVVPAPQLPAPQLMELERWPLLQAYGLEGVGRGGFFTMNFQVFDVYASMQSLYAELDARALAVLASAAVPTLALHWEEMLQGLGNRPAEGRAALSEKQVTESLAGYFTYGLLRPAPGVEQAITMPPRVLLGARTTDESAASDSASVASLMAAPGAGAAPPVHMAVEAADARSALRVARTYFLSQGRLAKDVFADPDEDAEQGFSFEAAAAGWHGDDVLLLMRLYQALADAAAAAIKQFAEAASGSASSAKATAQEVLTRRAEQLGVGGPWAQAVRFALWQCDHANKVTAPAVRGSRQLKVLKLSLPDIHSRSGPAAGKLLGSLVYADTFLDLPAVPAGATGGARPARAINMTAAVPTLLAITAGGPEAVVAGRAARSLARVLAAANSSGAAGMLESLSFRERAARREKERSAAAAAVTAQAAAVRARARRAGAVGAEAGEDEEEPESEEAAAGDDSAVRGSPNDALGRLLSVGGGDDTVLLTGSSACPALRGSLLCFSSGLVFVEATGKDLWVLDLKTANLDGITFQQLQATPEGGDGAKVELGEAVVFRGRVPACGLPPACHLTKNNQVAIALGAMSPAARRAIISSVLPAWQQALRDAVAGICAANYLRDMVAPNPFPRSLHKAQAYAVQTAAAQPAGTKVWHGVAEPDADVDAGMDTLDSLVMTSQLSGADPAVEALLAHRPPACSRSGGAGPGSSPLGSLGVTLVLGLPGCDQAVVASALATMLSDEGGVCRVALLPASAPEGLRKEELSTAIATASGEGCRQLVVATSTFLGAPQQLTLLARCPGAAGAPGAPGSWHLSAVVACINTDVVYEEPARASLFPGLLEQAAPGYIDCVVVGGTDSSKMQMLTQLLERRAPGVPVLKGARAALLRARAELLPDATERAARLAAPAATAERRWAPQAGAVGSGLGLLAGPLQGVQVEFEGQLDLARLRDELRRLGLPYDPAAPLALPLADASVPPQQQADGGAGRMVAMEGVVRGAAGGAAAPKASDLMASSQAALRSREWALEGTACQGLPVALVSGGAGGVLRFYGTALSARRLERLVASCAPGAAQATAAAAAAGSSGGKGPRTAASLTAAERAAIRAAHLLDPLPDGHYFNGTTYVDAFGDASPDHPEMDRFVQEWIQQQAAAEAAAASSAGSTGLRITRCDGPMLLHA